MTTIESAAAVGVFENRTQAEKAVEVLHRQGFRGDQIGVAVRSGDLTEPPPPELETKAAEGGAVAGALTGGAFGAVLGALATGLIPGLGWVIAGGLLAGIAGGVAVGAAAGGLAGAFLGLGISEEEAHFYAEELRAGRTIVTVKADGRFTEAISILHSLGAYDVHTPSYPPMPPVM